MILQTLNPKDPAIEAAVKHDYLQFARQELPLRQSLGYPPFRRIARVVVRSVNETMAEQASEALAQAIQDSWPDENKEESLQIIGPAPAPVTKLRGYYRFHFLVVTAVEYNAGNNIQQATCKLDLPDQVQWIVDIDALDMM